MFTVSDFEVGQTYVVKTTDWEVPDGSGIVPGKTVTVTVLPAQELGEATSFDGECRCLASRLEVESRKAFLRVRRPDGKVHLLHPENIDSFSVA